MCQIAGYIGKRPAAPILIDMMRRQEGWDGGFYTGMATMSGGRFYMNKVVGDLDKLIQNHTPDDFPGTVGFIHSRTPGGVGQATSKWAHPFFSTDGSLLYIANGTGGNFANTSSPLRDGVYMKLKTAGYRFSSATEGAGTNYTLRSDGLHIHTTDITCQSIQKYMDAGYSVPEACALANQELPGEIVGLAMHLGEPDCISWVRINYPMYVGIADHGIYLATTPQAMPEDAREITLLSPLSSGRVYRDRFETIPFPNPEITVAPVTPAVWKACYDAMETALKTQEMHHDQLDALIRPLFPEATCPPDSAVNYAIMNEFEKSGRLEIIHTRVPGQLPGTTAPRRTARLK